MGVAREPRERARVADGARRRAPRGSRPSPVRRAARSRPPPAASRTGAISSARSSAACSSSAFVFVAVKAAIASFTRSYSAIGSAPLVSSSVVADPVLVARRGVAEALLVDPLHQAARRGTDRWAEQERDRDVAVLRRVHEARRAAARRGRRPRSACSAPTPTGVARMYDCVARVTACCAETSTCCPRPERVRSWCAISAPTAASAPAWRYACGTTTRTGARSSSPVSASGPPAASTVRSVAASWARRAVLAEGRDRDVDQRRVHRRERRRSRGRAARMRRARRTRSGSRRVRASAAARGGRPRCRDRGRARACCACTPTRRASGRGRARPPRTGRAGARPRRRAARTWITSAPRSARICPQSSAPPSLRSRTRRWPSTGPSYTARATT